MLFFPAGLLVCFLYLRDEHVFAIIYGIFASYFSGIMVRLMLTLTPITTVLAAIGVSVVLDTYMKDGPLENPFSTKKKGKHFQYLFISFFF
jgi:dolichyl-diphosphooligosaccharide--protein glycosyltransferase